jgi:imidazolonepropionase-like amidohydrolase
VDVSGKVLMPGLVDTHSHVGSVEGADASAPLQPDVRALDSIDVRDARVAKARAGGVTTVNVMPGSGHLLSGQTVYLKLRQGNTIEELLLPNPKTGLLGGLKMANGTNPRRKPPFPGTRAKSAALVREQYVKALEYRQKLKDAGDDPKKRPDRDLGLEVLVQALDGRRMVHHHTHRHDDIVTVLRLAKEFGFRVTLHHVTEGWKVADEIAAAGVACSIIMVDSPGGKLETVDLDWKTAAALDKAGVLVAFHTDDPITESRFLLRSAALAVRAGMSREKALFGLTQAGAIILDLGDRIGSLAPGKDADFAVLSGDPLDYRTHVLETWVEGTKVFDLATPEGHLYASGGFGAGHDQTPKPHLRGDFDDEEQGR